MTGLAVAFSKASVSVLWLVLSLFCDEVLGVGVIGGTVD